VQKSKKFASTVNGSFINRMEAAAERRRQKLQGSDEVGSGKAATMSATFQSRMQQNRAAKVTKRCIIVFLLVCSSYALLNICFRSILVAKMAKYLVLLCSSP
jgi:hypothetical protein